MMATAATGAEPMSGRQGADVTARRRLDAELVRRGLAPSRARARDLVEANRVTVAGAMAAKPSRLVAPGESLVVLGARRGYVGRGGEKLAGALDRFALQVQGLRCIDVGSSTGGFTDCLLQRGAQQVAAIDVGRNQLHERLRADSRVALHERTDVRSVGPADVGGPGDIVVADLSFISVSAVAEHLVGLAADGAHLLVLVKPQFEAGKAAADRGRGVIRDPELWRSSLIRATDALAAAGAAIIGVVVSPLKGADGNVEFFVHARAGASASAQSADAQAIGRGASALGSAAIPAGAVGADDTVGSVGADSAGWIARVDAAVAEASGETAAPQARSGTAECG